MIPVHHRIFRLTRLRLLSASSSGQNMRLQALTKLNRASDTGLPCTTRWHFRFSNMVRYDLNRRLPEPGLI